MPSCTTVSVLLLELRGQRRRHRIGVLNRLLGGLVVVLAHVAIAAESERPVNDADPVVGLGIVGLQLDVLFVDRSSIPPSSWDRKACRRHVVKNGTDAIDRGEIIGIARQDVLEFLSGLVAIANIFIETARRECTARSTRWPDRAARWSARDRDPWPA